MKRVLYQFLFLLFFFVFSSCSNQHGNPASNSKIKSGISGTIVYQGTPVNWAYGYIYPTENTEFRQQFLESSEATGTDGKFTINVKPGIYYLAVRKRWNYSKIGPLRTGDFTADYFNNPIEVKENKFIDIGEIELIEIRDEADSIPEGSGITGRAFYNKNNAEDIYIYIYKDLNSDLRGPSYYIAKRIEEDGNFKINLLPGEYYMVARKRSTGAKLGPLEEEDFNFVYQKNPFTIVDDTYLDIGQIRLNKVDPKKLLKIKKGTLENKQKLSTGIRGIITNKKGDKIEGIYAFIYKDYQMVGKPIYRSAPTDKNGKYEILLAEGGVFYVGARNTYGGPLEPGDMVGSYNGSPDHLVKVEENKILENVDIVIEEFQ